MHLKTFAFLQAVTTRVCRDYRQQLVDPPGYLKVKICILPTDTQLSFEFYNIDNQCKSLQHLLYILIEV